MYVPGHRKPIVPSPRLNARDAVPRRLSKWHRSFLDGDILLKWTPYSQERLGPVLLFARNSKVPVIDFGNRLVLYRFTSPTSAQGQLRAMIAGGIQRLCAARPRRRPGVGGPTRPI